MTRPGRPSLILSAAAAGALSACATTPTAPRLHTVQELGVVAHGCGLELGEVVQEAEEPRLLFLFASTATRREVRCVRRWSHRRHLHFVHIEAVVDAEP
ncbi:MAG TPA: hypothetical protein VEW25_10550 [Allosphingosinicella sp.]|nr:hypothetical protein [Allosphingosinicella sp.]